MLRSVIHVFVKLKFRKLDLWKCKFFFLIMLMKFKHAWHLSKSMFGFSVSLERLPQERQRRWLCSVWWTWVYPEERLIIIYCQTHSNIHVNNSWKTVISNIRLLCILDFLLNRALDKNCRIIFIIHIKNLKHLGIFFTEIFNLCNLGLEKSYLLIKWIWW